MSIDRSKPSVPFEVIVSLNEPTDKLLDLLARRVAGIRLLSSKTNRGFGGACNAAVKQALGEFIVLLNDDAEVEVGWLEALVTTADANPQAGAIGSRVISPDGAAKEDGTILWADGSVTLIDAHHQPDPPSRPALRRVDYASAVSLLIPKQTWQAAGGFDEGYFPAYCEDVDLCLKVQALGHEILYQPASTVRHQHGASSSLPYRLFLLERNTTRLVQRWSHVLASRPSPAPEDAVARAEAIRAADERRPGPGAGPLLPDAVGSDELDADAYSLFRELSIMRDYISTLEPRLRSALDLLDNRPSKRLVRTTKSIVRRIPGVQPTRHWLHSQARRRRTTNGP